MVYCLIEIQSYTQLKRLHPPLISKMEKTIGDVIELHKGFTKYSSAGTILLSFTAKLEVDKAQLCESMYHIYMVFFDHKNELNGFTIILGDKPDPKDVDDILTEYEDISYSLLEEDVFWIFGGIPKAVSPYFQLENVKKSIYKVTAKKDMKIEHKTEKNSPSAELIRSEYANILLDTLQPYINNDSVPKALYIYGPAQIGKKSTLFYALKTLTDKNHSNILHIRRLSDMEPPLCSILRIVIENNKFEPTKYMNAQERLIWQKKQILLQSSIIIPYQGRMPVNLFRDMQVIFSIFLAAFTRFSAHNLFPAILFCENINQLDQYSKKLLSKTVNKYMENNRLICIGLLNKTDRPSTDEVLQNIPASSVSFTALTGENLQKYLETWSLTKQYAEQIFQTLNGLTEMQSPLIKHALYFTSVLEKNPPSQFENRNRISALTMPVLYDLGDSAIRTLFILYIARGTLDIPLIYQFLSQVGLENEEIGVSLQNLKKQDFISKDYTLTTISLHLKENIYNYIGNRKEWLTTQLASFLYKMWEKDMYTYSEVLYLLLKKTKLRHETLQVYHNLLMTILENFDISTATEYLCSKDMEALFSKEKHYKAIQYLFRMQKALLSENIENAENLYQKRPSNLEGTETILKAEIALQEGKYQLFAGSPENAITHAKQALLFYQGKGKTSGEQQSNILLGISMLANNKIEEAIEYFSLARAAKPKNNLLDIEIQNDAYSALSYFLYGNYSQALEITLSAREKEDKLFKREWDLYCRFLTGRIYHELGLYERAATEFQKTLASSFLYEKSAARKVAYAWLGRSYIYQGHYTKGMSILTHQTAETPETLLFQAEGYMFKEEYKTAIPLLRQALNISNDKKSYPRLAPLSWETGFASYENFVFRYISERNILTHLIRAFLGYALGYSGELEKGIDDLYRITREERISSFDPYNSLYYYLYSHILPEKENYETTDRLTVLSKALKFIQERASRIENSKQKTMYLYRNYWNSLLMKDARNNKLL